MASLMNLTVYKGSGQEPGDLGHAWRRRKRRVGSEDPWFSVPVFRRFGFFAFFHLSIVNGHKDSWKID